MSVILYGETSKDDVEVSELPLLLNKYQGVSLLKSFNKLDMSRFDSCCFIILGSYTIKHLVLNLTSFNMLKRFVSGFNGVCDGNKTITILELKSTANYEIKYLQDLKSLKTVILHE